ncbi:MAG TPA: glycosyltransferase family 87 protein [Streptosporangiaceae bacterium]|nr:glycosyltransferase family 87 protein [Streptosporangiaceae bacterium]
MGSTGTDRTSTGAAGPDGTPADAARGTAGRRGQGQPGQGGPVSGQDRGRRPGREWLGRTWAVWLVTGAAWAMAAALIAYMVYCALTNPGHLRMPDLEVYRNGGESIRNGSGLYTTLTNGKLLFTYPPVSGVLSVPLTWVPAQAARAAWMLMVYLPLAVVIWLAFRPVLARAGRYAPAVLGLLITCGTLLTPMRQEVHYGQIDIFLVALCALDCLARRPRWPRGALIGLATAIKLVPGVFVIYLLITGRRKAAAVAAGSFAAWTGLAWLIAPEASAHYWTSAVFNASRLGQNAQAANQSLNGMLLRAFFPHPPPAVLWIAVALLVGVAGFAIARVVSRRGFELGGVASTGLLAALLSPVAWVHHYCWVILAIGAIAGNCRSERRVIAAIVAGGLFMSVMPIFGGYVYYTHLVPALPAMLLQDGFGLAALGLIWIIFRIRVTSADRWLSPGPALAEGPEPATGPAALAGRHAR